MKSLTYVDANVLILACRFGEEEGETAREILGQINRRFIASDILRLEVLPKARYHKRIAEEQFYNEYFNAVEIMACTTSSAMRDAEVLASELGLAAADALHLVAAVNSNADEFVTAELPYKPMFRFSGIPITSIRST